MSIERGRGWECSTAWRVGGPLLLLVVLLSPLALADGDTPATMPAALSPSSLPVRALAYEPRSRLIAVARRGCVEIWSADARDIIRRLDGLKGDVNAVAFSEDGAVFAAGGGEVGKAGLLWAWRVDDWQQGPPKRAHADAIYSVAVSSVAGRIATGAYDGKAILRAFAGEPRWELEGHGPAVFGVAFGPGGKTLATAGADGEVALWAPAGN